jgi:hypothetical protein
MVQKSLIHKSVSISLVLFSVSFLSSVHAENIPPARDNSQEFFEGKDKSDILFRGTKEDEAAFNKVFAAITADGVRKKHAEDNKNNPNPAVPAKRDAHAKSNACVTASLTVDPALANNELSKFRKGIFSEPGRKYDEVTIRFSNGSKDNDSEPDGRGMAVKVHHVGQNVYLEDKVNAKPQQSQDFIMISFPQFFLKNSTDYMPFKTDRKAFFDSHPLEAGIAQSIALSQLEKKTPLAMNFFSMTAYYFGKGQPAKFQAQPCKGQEFINAEHPSPENILGENLTEHLKTKSACFDFYVQLQDPGLDADTKARHVEDATLLWSEGVQKIATINIPAQTPESTVDCDRLSYNPAHAVEDQQHLGRINRTREVVYQTIFETREALNHPTR